MVSLEAPADAGAFFVPVHFHNSILVHQPVVRKNQGFRD
jgi:hypothetical protein